jgi:DNA helicase-2/ATP-dependent DNA helicase PcrA
MLNEAQKEAVETSLEPTLIIAGAGGGKTLTMTHRVAKMVSDHDLLPSRLMVTTFTNAAADEMRDRLRPMVGESTADRLKMGTFHSLCFGIIKDYCFSKDLENPSVIMPFSAYMVVKGYISDNKLSISPMNAIKTISEYKNDGLTPDDIYADMVSKHGEAFLNTSLGRSQLRMHDIYSAYQSYLYANSKIDFDEMLLYCLRLLTEEKYSKFAKKVFKKTEGFIVDEAQDLNLVQYKIIQRFMDNGLKNVTLVLDDFQSIYSFRGANVEHLFSFIEKNKPKLIKLETNYRSSRSIVEMSNTLISKNENQIKKVLNTPRGPEIIPVNVVLDSSSSEAMWIVDKVRQLKSEGYEYKDMAVLYRVNAQSRDVVDHFMYHDIPHYVFSKWGFYDRKEIKDLVTYINLLNQPEAMDIRDFKMILNRPNRFLKKTILDDFENLMISRDLNSMYEAFEAIDELETTHQQKNAFLDFYGFIVEGHKLVNQGATTLEILDFILDQTKYVQFLEGSETKKEDEDNDDYLNIESLRIGCQKFDNVDEFIGHVDSIQHRQAEAMFDEDSEGFISLMTIHKSKGKEFPIVFLVGLSEKLLPHYRSGNMEEERRVCYVAVTRAKNILYMTSINGKYGRLNVTPSKFLYDMDYEGLKERYENTSD